ncbi:MAG: hypothetical protein IH899_03620 [Planctomycetes bacterium]|nr:hypothetical protein [Planctomycetota bacterium]
MPSGPAGVARWLLGIRSLKAIMGRWPDQSRSTWTTFLLIFVLFPLLALLAWWFVRG